MSDTTSKDDELHNQIFEIAEVNVTNQETGKDLYAIDPIKLIEFIKAHTNKAIGEVLDMLDKSAWNFGSPNPDTIRYVIDAEAIEAERIKLKESK